MSSTQLPLEQGALAASGSGSCWEQPLSRKLQCALTADTATECSLSSGLAQHWLCTTVELFLQSRPHVSRLPLPTDYNELMWLLVTDTLMALEFLCRTEDRAGGEEAVPAASGSDSCIPEPTGWAAASLCCFIPA